MIYECKDCNYYESRDSYPGKGWCDIHLTYVRENETCDNFEEED